MKKWHRKREAMYAGLVCAALALFAITLIFMAYSHKVAAIEREQVEQTSHEIATQAAALLYERLDDSMEYIESLGGFLGDLALPLDPPQLREHVRTRTVMREEFSAITPVAPDGVLYDEDGSPLGSLAGKDYFKAAMRGETVLAAVPDSLVGGEDLIVVVAPIAHDGEIAGVLHGRFAMDELKQYLSSGAFGGKSYSYLATKDGELLARSDNPAADPQMQNLAKDFAGEQCSYDEAQLQGMLREMQDGGEGRISYAWKGAARSMCYIPVGINDWYLLTVVPQSIVASRSEVFVRQLLFLTAIVVTVALIFAFVFARQRAYSRDALRQSETRYALIMEQTQDIIFEWDPRKKAIEHSRVFEQKFGYQLDGRDFPRGEAVRAVVYPDDYERFLAIYEKLEEGAEFAADEFRIRCHSGDFIWCRVSATAIRDVDGELRRVIGLIQDIDEQKTALQKLTELARRDAMTQLYNKTATMELISTRLARLPESAAFLMLDIDNFKQINDTLGHGQGDAVLLTLAQKLRAQFRNSDIVGRIGGDEFVLFLENLGEDVLKNKANAVLTEFAQAFPQEKVDCSVTCSMGIARYPQDGATFAALYRKADIALYAAKKCGKNHFVLYHGALERREPVEELQKRRKPRGE